MNINSENYEAYLIDYIDGQLSEKESRQLKQFLAQQGLNIDELTQELPILKPQHIEYKYKELLKKKATIVPLLAKITSAVAVIALLFGIFWNRNNPIADQQSVLETQPILVQKIDNQSETQETESNEDTPFIEKQNTYKPQPQDCTPQANSIEVRSVEIDNTREIVPLLAQLEPKATYEVQLSDDYLVENGLLPSIPLYPIYYEEPIAEDADFQYNEEYSWLEKGIIWLSKGKCSHIGELLNYGLHHTSHELIHYTAKAAYTAYYTIDNQIEGTKERQKEELKK